MEQRFYLKRENGLYVEKVKKYPNTKETPDGDFLVEDSYRLYVTSIKLKAREFSEKETKIINEAFKGELTIVNVREED